MKRRQGRSSGHQFDVSTSKWYKTVLILETPFWVACAAESMEIGIIVIGASNKSGRRFTPSDESNTSFIGAWYHNLSAL